MVGMGFTPASAGSYAVGLSPSAHCAATPDFGPHFISHLRRSAQLPVCEVRIQSSPSLSAAIAAGQHKSSPPYSVEVQTCSLAEAGEQPAT